MNRQVPGILAIFISIGLLLSMLIGCGPANVDGPAGPGKVMTVLGPIPIEELGMCRPHEHICWNFAGYIAYRSLVPLDDTDWLIENYMPLIKPKIEQMKEYGVESILDATTNDNCRFPEFLKAVSEETSVNIIMTTGFYTYDSMGASKYYQTLKMTGRTDEQDEHDIYRLFVAELTTGVQDTGIKAGVIKIATGESIKPSFDEAVCGAAVKASKEMGVPIITHNEGSSVAEQADMLLAAGAEPRTVQLGHLTKLRNVSEVLEIIEKGEFFLGFDQLGIYDNENQGNNIIELIKMGYADRICLGQDYIFVLAGEPENVGGFAKALRDSTWTPTYIYDTLIPKMKANGVTDDQIEQMLIRNPQNLFRNAQGAQ